MFFNILEVNQYYTYSSIEDSLGITFKLSLSGNDYIEIGQEYVVASSNKQWLMKDKKFANASVTFYDILSIERTAPEIVRKLLQSDKEVIGTGGFHEETESDFETYPANLYFSIWLSSKSYRHLTEQLLYKNIPSDVAIFVEGLKYGWEPDGSHQIWDIAINGKDNLLRINRVLINYKPHQETILDIEANEVIKEQQQNEKKEILANSGEKSGQVSQSDFKKILSNIYSLLVVIAVLIAISIYMH